MTSLQRGRGGHKIQKMGRHRLWMAPNEVKEFDLLPLLSWLCRSPKTSTTLLVWFRMPKVKVNYRLILICRNPKVNLIEPKAEKWGHCFRSLTFFNQCMLCIGVGGVTSTNFAIYKNTFRRRCYQNAFSNLTRRFLNDIWKKKWHGNHCPGLNH